MRNIMKRAWEYAKMGVRNFGGKATDYLSESLKIAWKESKEYDFDSKKELFKNILNEYRDLALEARKENPNTPVIDVDVLLSKATPANINTAIKNMHYRVYIAKDALGKTVVGYQPISLPF